MSNVTRDSTSYNEYKVAVFIWKAVPPALIILGTFGNVFTIIVLTRKSIRSSTTALYLTVLAVSDLVVLYSGLLRQWLRFLFDTDVRHVSNAGCKINIWFVYTSLDFSAWLLIAVTLERVISAWFPHNAKTTCTKKSALALMSSILVFLLLLNSHMLYGMEFKYDINGTVINDLRCTEIDIDYVYFFNKVWPWIDLCAFCLVPCSVIVVGNSLILFKVIKSQKKTKSRIVPAINAGTGQRHGPTHGKQSSMTAMLFTLNVVFLLSTSPVSIYNIGYAHWNEDAENTNDNHKLAVLDLWWAIVNMLMYTNNSLNFLLYCLSGTKFRREVVRMFCPNGRGAQNQMIPSNYTRTKFEASSAPASIKRSPSDISAVSAASTSNKTGSRSTLSKPGLTNGEQRLSTISGNLLHPDSALNMKTFEIKDNANESALKATSEV